MNEKISLKFEPLSMIRLLGVQLYDTPLAMLRENVQNAVDAIRMRLSKDSTFEPEVKVTISDDTIKVSDNGIGMTENDLKESFWNVGHSGKNTEEAKKAGVIGHFGIGALANFGVCTRLEVNTRKYNSNIRIISIANKAELSGDNIDINSEEDNSDNYGTEIIATLENKGSINDQVAIDYLRPYVSYVDIPILINGILVSKEEVTIKKRSNSTHSIDSYNSSVGFDYNLVYNNYQPINPELLISNITIDGANIKGRVYLNRTNNSGSNIMGLCNGFGLANLSLISSFNFSGFMDFPFLEPTAGREAVSRESTALAQRILNAIEKFWAKTISKNAVVDNYREFLYYAANNFSRDITGQITITLAAHNTSIKLKEIDDPQKFIFYAGNDSATINSYSSSPKTLLRLAGENPKRKVQRLYLNSIKVEEVGNKIEILKEYTPDELEYYESMILIEIKNIIEDDYIITGFDVKFAEISMGVMYFIKSDGQRFTIYISRKSPDIQNIISVYKNNYSLYKPLVKDLVRTSLYNLFADYIPKDKKTRAAYIDRVFNNRREEYILTVEDRGELADIYNKIKSKDIGINEFIDFVKHKTTNRSSQQEIDRGQIGNVDTVVKTISSDDTISPNVHLDVMTAQPPILELDNTTTKKLLTTDIETPILHNNKMFLSISDRMNRDFRSFFLLPHTTKVIWSMHRIIYIFTDITKSISLYYEMELTKKLPEDQTGGEPILSTTIVTAKRIFVPVIHQLYDYFNREINNKLTFIVHFEKVLG